MSKDKKKTKKLAKKAIKRHVNRNVKKPLTAEQTATQIDMMKTILSRQPNPWTLNIVIYYRRINS